MIVFLLILFLILWGILVFTLLVLIHSSNKDLEIIDYVYKPNIEIGDTVKLSNIRQIESPDLLNKNFEITQIIGDTVFLKSNDNIMITRNLYEIEKICKFIN